MAGLLACVLLEHTAHKHYHVLCRADGLHGDGGQGLQATFYDLIGWSELEHTTKKSANILVNSGNSHKIAITFKTYFNDS